MEDITTQVAAAPRNLTKRMPSLHELQRELQHVLPEPSSRGPDITPLKRFLVPYELVQEEDEAWDFESLLQQVSQEQQADNEAEEKRKRAAAAEAARAEAATMAKAKAFTRPSAGKARGAEAPSADGVVPMTAADDDGDGGDGDDQPRMRRK